MARLKIFRSKAEKQQSQQLLLLQSQITILRQTFPEGSYIPTCNPLPGNASDLAQEVVLLQKALSAQPEHMRASTGSGVPAVPPQFVELDATDTAQAGPPVVNLDARIHTTYTPSFYHSHLEIDLGVLGLKTVHLYIIGGIIGSIIISLTLLNRISQIVIRAMEIYTVVFTTPAVVRSITIVGVVALPMAIAGLAYAHHSNNARKVAEKHLEVQGQREVEKMRLLASVRGQQEGVRLLEGIIRPKSRLGNHSLDINTSINA